MTQGNKVACTIIYTPASNLLKKGDFATGAVSFKNDRKVRSLPSSAAQWPSVEHVSAHSRLGQAIPHPRANQCSRESISVSLASLHLFISTMIRQLTLFVAPYRKTKVTREVDHEYEKIEREKEEAKRKRLIATEQVRSLSPRSIPYFKLTLSSTLD